MTHVAAREDVAENLLLTQVDFFRQALAEPASNLAPAGSNYYARPRSSWPATGQVQADSSRPPAASSKRWPTRRRTSRRSSSDIPPNTPY